MIANVGTLFLSGGLGCSGLAATVFFYASVRRKLIQEKTLKRLVLAPLFFVVAASLLLWILIFSNDFTVYYVAQYSSTDLPLMYKISAFWAGQQGSFLFWLLIHSLAGYVLALKKPLPGTLGIHFFLQFLLGIFIMFNPPFFENPIEVNDGF